MVTGGTCQAGLPTASQHPGGFQDPVAIPQRGTSPTPVLGQQPQSSWTSIFSMQKSHLWTEIELSAGGKVPQSFATLTSRVQTNRSHATDEAHACGGMSVLSQTCLHLLSRLKKNSGNRLRQHGQTVCEQPLTPTQQTETSAVTAWCPQPCKKLPRESRGYVLGASAQYLPATTVMSQGCWWGHPCPSP